MNPTTCPTCGGPRPVRPPDPCSDEFHHGPRKLNAQIALEAIQRARAAEARVAELEDALDAAHKLDGLMTARIAELEARVAMDAEGREAA